ncbi:MAG: hypothetical protein AAGG01_11730, partial [Planctomycetota bacterium]
YRAIYEAYRDRRWQEIIELQGKIEEQALAGANLRVFLATATAETEDDLELPEDSRVGATLLSAASRGVGASPFAVEALEHLGRLYLKKDQKSDAIETFDAMRDGFGWQKGVEERVESWLKKASLK